VFRLNPFFSRLPCHAPLEAFKRSSLAAINTCNEARPDDPIKRSRARRHCNASTNPGLPGFVHFGRSVLSVFFRSLSDRLVRPPPTSLSIKTFSANLLYIVPRGERIKEGLTLRKCNDSCIWWSSKSTWSFFMSQENETDKCVTFPTFDAFSNFLLDLLIDEFGTAEARWVYCNEEMAGSFVHYYDNPGQWNDVHAMALRNLICVRKAQSTAFIANLLKEFFQWALPHSAADGAVGHDSAEVAP
jgi:hypothetical protein